MSMVKVGERVGAISHEKDGTVYLYDYGVRMEDALPHSAAGWMAAALCAGGVPNPQILLDSGQTVWGCECWWGSEESVRKSCKGKQVVPVDIDARRKEYSDEATSAD